MFKKKTSIITPRLLNKNARAIKNTKENIEIFKKTILTDILHSLFSKEVVIVSLKLGYVNGKRFTNEEIGKFLKLDKKEVTDVTRSVLLKYKEHVNLMIDESIKTFNEDKTDYVAPNK